MASRNTNLHFCNDPLPCEPPRDCYPANDDVMRYYINHIKANHDRNAVKPDQALFVKDILEKGNGIPKSYFVFRNNLMDSTVLTLYTDVKEEEVKTVTGRR